MNLRLAVMSDLSQIIEMYKKIIAKMNDNGIHIWDEIYPCKYFKNDIEIISFIYYGTMIRLFRHLFYVI